METEEIFLYSNEEAKFRSHTIGYVVHECTIVL